MSNPTRLVYAFSAEDIQDYDRPLRTSLGSDIRSPPEKRQRRGHETQDFGEAVGYYPNTDYQYSESDVSSDIKSDFQASQLHAKPLMSYSTASDAQPKSLSDLVK